MTFKTLLVRSTVALLICAALVAVCYFFIDRPVAFFVYDHEINHHAFLKWMTYTPIYLERLAVLVIILAVVRLARGPLKRCETTLFAMAVNLAVTLMLKNFLKFAFGRYWPDTWIFDNPSLIQDGAYGFHPFHGGMAYGDFPSGHTARIFALMSVLWIVYPRWRPVCVLLCGSVMVGLVGMNYHFVGDVVAGAFLGSITGRYAVHFFGLDRRSEPEASAPDGPSLTLPART